MSCFAFTVTRASTPERARLLNNTIVQARQTAGAQFHWLMIGSGLTGPGYETAKAAHSAGMINDFHLYGDNVGQHVAWNRAYQAAKAAKAKYLLRIDDDCDFPSKRWLKKLIEASVRLDDKMVIAPTVRGLKNPPDRSQVVMVKDMPVEFLAYAIGGICRLHPMALLDDFIADVRKPLGSGDATGIASYCREHDPVIPMIYLKRVRVKHKTAQQEEADPDHFQHHEIFQHIPYIPAWKPDDEVDRRKAV